MIVFQRVIVFILVILMDIVMHSPLLLHILDLHQSYRRARSHYVVPLIRGVDMLGYLHEPVHLLDLARVQVMECVVVAHGHECRVEGELGAHI